MTTLDNKTYHNKHNHQHNKADKHDAAHHAAHNGTHIRATATSATCPHQRC